MNQYRFYSPFTSPLDPCPPVKQKMYVVPPNLFMGYQPMNLPQFKPYDALKLGTLWPALYSPYEGKKV